MEQGFGKIFYKILLILKKLLITFIIACIYLRVDEERVVKNIQHEIPWGLRSQETPNISKQKLVQVIEGLGADRIDMSVVRDEFTPANFSLSGWLGGWVDYFLSVFLVINLYLPFLFCVQFI